MTMTLSVVPVRFEYACGHTALTSLPRVKAESPAQRIVRISQEKAAAGQRACDFCPPISSSSLGSSDLDGVGRLTVALAPLAIAPSMIDGIDNPPLEHAVAGEQVPEQEQEEAMTTTTTEPVSEPATARDERPATPETTQAPTLPKGVFPLRKLTDEQEREVTRLYADTTTPLVEIGRRFGIAQTSVARMAQRRGALLRSPTISLLRRFVVTFSAEQVLEAASALDALQQVQARGATEVTAIVRTD